MVVITKVMQPTVLKRFPAAELCRCVCTTDAGDVSPNLAGHGGGHGAAGLKDVEDIGESNIEKHSNYSSRRVRVKII